MQPLLAHIHVPKCAGTSVRLTLDKVFGPMHLNLYFAQTTFVLDEVDLAEFIRPPEIKAFSSHYVRTFPPTLANRQLHYVTFLRDPVQQLISYVTHMKQQFLNLHDPLLRKHLPPNMPELSVRECVRWILSGDPRGFRNFRDNYTTNIFARHVVLQNKRYSYGDGRYRRIRLNVAKEVLSRFLFVGISEHLDESWAAMCRACQNVGIDVPTLRLPHENVSSELRDDLSWIHERDEVGRMLLASVREDQALYATAQKQFERQLANPTTPPRHSVLHRLFG